MEGSIFGLTLTIFYDVPVPSNEYSSIRYELPSKYVPTIQVFIDDAIKLIYTILFLLGFSEYILQPISVSVWLGHDELMNIPFLLSKSVT